MYAYDEPIIAVLGSKNSGKTMAVEVLAQGLSSSGYRVATAKHVPKPNFTIDREGTDTWRHARAGANIVVSVSPNELVIIKRVDTRDFDPTEITMQCGEDVDLIILEGFKKLVATDPRILKIVAVRNVEEIHQASTEISPVLAYVGSIPAGEVPQSLDYFNLLKEKEKLVNLVHEKVKDIKSGSKPLRRTNIVIDGKALPCKRFVQEIIRKTVLAMISTLKGVNVTGDEEVHITIRSEDH